VADKKKRRRSRNGFVDIANALLTLVVIGLVIAGGAMLWGAQQFYSDGPATTEQRFLVDRGAGLETVATRLENQGLIANRFIFLVMGRVLDKQRGIKAGEFVIPARSSMSAILTELTTGDPVEYFINVPPGESSYQVAQRLNTDENLSGDPIPVPAEGTILPVRHDYFPHDNRETVLKRMQDEMTAAVDKAWAACAADVCGEGQPIKTKADLVTMASIVEKETGLETERPMVAALFINRLRQGMKLQTDPTIIYGLTRGERPLDGGITASQKAAETPYNTYIIDGLPPTPIANPGEAALMAVAQPADSEFLYMMAVTPGKPSDGHYFASTLSEHQANEAKYRRLEDQQAAAEAAATEGPAEGETPAADDAPPDALAQ
jgi:UPF0755 protein